MTLRGGFRLGFHSNRCSDCEGEGTVFMMHSLFWVNSSTVAIGMGILDVFDLECLGIKFGH